MNPAPAVTLRPVEPDDIPLFYRHELDRASRHAAAFMPAEPPTPDHFIARWRHMLADPAITARTITADAAPVGHVASFFRGDDREVTYWIDTNRRNRGLATAGLRAFLAEEPARPLWARAALDNTPSVRVLEKCGFVRDRVERFFAEARNEEIEEAVMALR